MKQALILSLGCLQAKAETTAYAYTQNYNYETGQYEQYAPSYSQYQKYAPAYSEYAYTTD